jgi:HAD superfamily hydrolase (TIGR01509 family)
MTDIKKVIIFDLDGVLINSEPIYYNVWRNILARRGIDFSYELYQTCIGATPEFLLKTVQDNYGWDFSKDPTYWDEIVAEKKKIIDEDGYPEIPGIRPMLEGFRDAGYIMAIASSSAQIFIDDAVNHLHIRSYFQSIISAAASGSRSKPAPDIYLWMADKLQVPPNECTVLEDSSNGCKAAVAAGMVCVGFFNPDSGKQDLSSADYIISGMREFTPALVENIKRKAEKNG